MYFVPIIFIPKRLADTDTNQIIRTNFLEYKEY